MKIESEIAAALAPELLQHGFRLHHRALDEALAILRARVPDEPPPAADLDIDDVYIGSDPKLRLRLYRPRGRAAPGSLVNLHGGGWVAGSIEQDDERCRIFTRMTGCVTISVAYRLAPEHPFPAGVNDCAQALAWARNNSRQLGATTDTVVAIGTSAGANLAAGATYALLRERSSPPDGQVLLYPICSPSLDFPSCAEKGTGHFLTLEDMIWYWNQYGDATLRTDPRANLLVATDLADTPPTLILTSDNDPLRDEGEAFAARLGAAGAEVELVRHAGTVHGFLNLAPAAPASRQAFAEVAEFVQRVMERSAS